MQVILRSPEGEVIDHTATADIAGGDVIVVSNAVIGVAQNAIASGDKGGLIIENEKADIVKTAVALTLGDKLYWQAAGDPVGGTTGTGACQGTSGTAGIIGVALASATSGAATVRGRLIVPKWHPLT